MGQRITKLAFANRKLKGPNPVVEGLAELVDAQFFQMQQDEGIEATGQIAYSHRPTGHSLRTGEPPARQGTECLAHQRMGQMYHHGIDARTEDRSAGAIVDEGCGAKSQIGHGAQSALCGGPSHGFVNGVAPARQSWIEYPITVEIIRL